MWRDRDRDREKKRDRENILSVRTQWKAYGTLKLGNLKSEEFNKGNIY